LIVTDIRGQETGYFAAEIIEMDFRQSYTLAVKTIAPHVMY